MTGFALHIGKANLIDDIFGGLRRGALRRVRL